MTDGEKLFVIAACVSDEAKDIVCTVKDGKYGVVSDTGDKFTKDELLSRFEGIEVVPRPFKDYAKEYAYLFGIFSMLGCVDSLYKGELLVMDKFCSIDLRQCVGYYRVVGEYLILRTYKDSQHFGVSQYALLPYTCYVFTPKGSLLCVTREVNELKPKTLESIERSVLLKCTYESFYPLASIINKNKEVADNVITELEDSSARELLYIRECGYRVSNSAGVPEVELLTMSCTDDRVALSVVGYAVLYNLLEQRRQDVQDAKRFKKEAADKKAAELPADGNIETLLFAYLKAMRLTKRVDVCNEIARLVKVSCDTNSVEALTSLLQDSLQSMEQSGKGGNK